MDRDDIDLRYLINDAKVNLSIKINHKMLQYKKEKNKELKKDIIKLLMERKKLFLFDKEVILKYIN